MKTTQNNTFNAKAWLMAMPTATLSDPRNDGLQNICVNGKVIGRIRKDADDRCYVIGPYKPSNNRFKTRAATLTFLTRKLKTEQPLKVVLEPTANCPRCQFAIRVTWSSAGKIICPNCGLKCQGEVVFAIPGSRLS